MQINEKIIEKYRWNRVLLINPNYTSNGWVYLKVAFPPLNLMYIASYIIDLGIELKILDARAENLTYSRLKRKIEKFNPNIVGISVFVTSAINCCIDIAKMVKEINADCKVVLGGRHPTFVAEDTLNLNCIDYIIRGEGELTFRELIIKGKPENINGISYRKNGEIIHNPDRSLMRKEDFANIRLPARTLVRKNKYKLFGLSLDAIETSRGCPFSCNFCSTSPFFNKIWRARKIDNVINELKRISHNGKITDIYITDDNFAINSERIEKLCERIIDCKKKNEIRDFKFFTQLRADDIVKSPKMVEKMSKAGFWVVFIGIESVNEDTLKDINKKVTFDEIMEAVKILHANDIIVFGSLIIGLDLNATEEMIRKDIRFINKTEIDLINVLSLSPFLGTELYNELDEKGLIVSKDWSNYDFLHPVTKTYQLTLKQIYDLIIYSFKEIKLKNNVRGILNRIIRKRGFLFILNPLRIIFIMKSYMKMKGLSKGFLC